MFVPGRYEKVVYKGLFLKAVVSKSDASGLSEASLEDVNNNSFNCTSNNRHRFHLTSIKLVGVDCTRCLSLAVILDSIPIDLRPSNLQHVCEKLEGTFVNVEQQ